MTQTRTEPAFLQFDIANTAFCEHNSTIMNTSFRPVELELTTERLRLSPLGVGDQDIAAELFTDPNVMRYVAETVSEEAIRHEFPVWITRGAGGRIGVWTVTDRTTGEKLGTAILLPLPIDLDDTDWSLIEEDRYPDAEIEIGYILKPAAWGKGYATEICTRLLRFGFECTTLDEIVAITDPDNDASQHVLKKCGLRHEGQRRAYAADDCEGFRITRDQWLQHQQAS